MNSIKMTTYSITTTTETPSSKLNFSGNYSSSPSNLLGMFHGPPSKPFIGNRSIGGQRLSESDSDDSFIVFQEASPCKSTINFRRSHQVSECSSCDDGKDCSDDETTNTESYSPVAKQTNVQPMKSQVKKKKVKFNLQPIIREMHAWKFAYAQARKGHWHHIGWDYERFRRRINEIGQTIAPILVADHRQRIFEERFHGKFNE